MTTKDYLNQISRLNRMINNKLSEISQLRELSRSISAVKNEERVMSSSDPDKIGSTYAKIDEMEHNLDNMIDEYIEKKDLIIGQIDGIENEDCYNILFSRYIEKKTFEVSRCCNGNCSSQGSLERNKRNFLKSRRLV